MIVPTTIIVTKAIGRVVHNSGEFVAIVPFRATGLDTGLILDIGDTKLGTEEFQNRFPEHALLDMTRTVELKRLFSNRRLRRGIWI